MTLRKLLALALLAVWMALPSPSSALGNWKQCANLDVITTGAITTQIPVIAPRGKLCYQFDNGAVAGSESPPIKTSAKATQICFDPDTGGVAGAGRTEIWYCPYGIPSGSTRVNSCFVAVDTALVGGGGSAATQTACTPQNQGPGTYVVVPTIAAGAGEEATVTFSGLGE